MCSQISKVALCGSDRNLTSYDFNIEHIQGRLHGNADALSIRKCTQCGANCPDTREVKHVVNINEQMEPQKNWNTGNNIFSTIRTMTQMFPVWHSRSWITNDLIILTLYYEAIFWKYYLTWSVSKSEMTLKLSIDRSLSNWNKSKGCWNTRMSNIKTSWY